jgi:hypothetical protein
MRFDSNRAWTEATAIVAANRAMLWAVAGVFLVLPIFAITLLSAPPEPPAGADPRALMELMSGYYTQAAPWLLGMAVLQIIGTLTMLALFTDRTRPTVGEALQRAVKGLVPMILAQILAGAGVFAVAMVLITITAATGSTAVIALGVLIALAGLIYVMVRISMVAPVVMVEGQGNPVAALRRSWDLTGVNVWRLLLFYALLFIGMWIVVLLLSGLADLGLRLVLGDSIGGPLAAFIGAALQGVMTIYFTAVYAATHRQLAGPSAEAAARPFE